MENVWVGGVAISLGDEYTSGIWAPTADIQNVLNVYGLTDAHGIIDRVKTIVKYVMLCSSHVILLTFWCIRARELYGTSEVATTVTINDPFWIVNQAKARDDYQKLVIAYFSHRLRKLLTYACSSLYIYLVTTQMN